MPLLIPKQRTNAHTEYRINSNKVKIYKFRLTTVRLLPNNANQSATNSLIPVHICTVHSGFFFMNPRMPAFQKCMVEIAPPNVSVSPCVCLATTGRRHGALTPPAGRFVDGSGPPSVSAPSSSRYVLCSLGNCTTSFDIIQGPLDTASGSWTISLINRQNCTQFHSRI